MPKTTLKTAKAILKNHEMTISKNQYGEYRVNFKNGNEDSALYTNEIDDAIASGINMRQRQDIADGSYKHEILRDIY